MRVSDFDRDQLIAIYGLFQIELKSIEVLDSGGAPVVSKKHSEANFDALGLYKWLALKLKYVPEHAINKRKEVFNTIVKGLNQEYFLNMSLMTVFMMEYLITTDGSKAQKIVLMPKINRLIKFLRMGILEEQEEGLRIVRDSKIGASNVMAIFNGGYELTKEMRSWKADQWRKAAQEAENESH